MVTPALFAEFPTPETLAAADIKRVEELIKTCGLYKTKAKDLCGIGKMLTEQYGGKVPDTIEELTRLPGIGRKLQTLCAGIFSASRRGYRYAFYKALQPLGAG